MDTYSGVPITLGNQRDDAGNLLGHQYQTASLHMARVRVHDDVLTPEQILSNYDEEKVDFISVPLEGIQIAGELFVDLDAADPSAGTATWMNKGTAGDFNVVGDPFASDVDGIPTVAFNLNEGPNDAYETANPAPAGLTGVQATSTIEVWVWNESVADEESLVSWSRRGPDGLSNMSFNYGVSGSAGAVGRWSGDMAWSLSLIHI